MISIATMTRWLLPVGLVVSLALGLTAPELGMTVGSWRIGPLDWVATSVVLIFLISGFCLSLSSVGGDGFARAAGLVIAANLLIPPVIAFGALALFNFSEGVAFGIAVMASVPTTLSTATVMAVIAGADRTWAVGLTVVCSVVGAFSAPITFSLILMADVNVPAMPLLVTVASIVILPLIIGLLAARLVPRPAPEWVSLVPSAAVVGVVWVTISGAQSEIVRSPWARLLALAGVALIGHLVLLTLGWGVSRRFVPRHGRAMLFVVAQKTLPLGLSLIVAATDVAPELTAAASLAVLVCIVWHFLQLFVDSVLASRLPPIGQPGQPALAG
jgi:predicted Na+-dependent transporter